MLHETVRDGANALAPWIIGTASISISVSACVGGMDDHFTVRDSAGVRIVENRAPSWAGGADWTVEPSPYLTIGTSGGPPEYQFYRVQGAVRLGDGRIAVADGGSGEIRFFDASGRFLKSTGGEGDAPGEYRQIAALGALPGDSLWVYDFGLRRFTLLGHDGDVSRTVQVVANLSAVNAVGLISDGSFVLQELWGSAVQHGGRGGLTREPAAVVRLSADGTTIDTVGVFPGREVFVGSEDGRAVMSTPLFARSTMVIASAGDVMVGNREKFEIDVYTPLGNLMRSVRVSGVDLSISRDAVARLIEDALAEVPTERRAMQRTHMESMDLPPSRPAHGRLLVDTEGHLWVAEYTRYPTPSVRWSVFDQAGRWLGLVTVPPRFQLYQVGADLIIGVSRDELGVEYVTTHRLLKP